MNSTTNTGITSLTTSRVFWFVLLYCFLLVAIFFDTAWSMVEIWYRTGTYAHGFLILPISLWLIWEKRALLVDTPVRANFFVLFLMLAVGLTWLLAHLVDVLVVQQLALVGLLVLGIWTIVGNAVARVLVFPLFFLFLGVPMGEDLVQPLMDVTASSTVRMIQMTGIPVYREGMFFSLPSGNWSVVEACSGVRYLIASFTLGLLYAYMTYRSMFRRLLFVLAAILVPIVANSLRAYGIVMLGHLSGMTIATGVDHLIYGWIFFGLVMLLLFWLGAFWREDEDNDGLPLAAPKPSGSNTIVQATGAVPLAFVAALSVAGLPPVLAASFDRIAPRAADAQLPIPAAVDGWALLSEATWTWRPVNSGADRELVQFYQHRDQTVALYLNQYFDQSQGAELEGGGRKFFDRELDWKIASQARADVLFPEETMSVDAVTMRGPEGRIAIWSWYRIGHFYTASSYMVKLLELWETLGMRNLGSTRIVLAVNLVKGVDPELTLQSFLTLHLPGIVASLDQDVAK